MAWGTISFKGEALGRCNSIDVLLPDRITGRLGVLYLLHGLSDDQGAWNRFVPIADLLRDAPLIVVMPNGGAEFYCNNPAPGGGQFEDHIVRDVVGFVDRTFPTVAERKGRALAGNSMGGYGSTMLALRHPDMFAAAVNLSGAMYFAHRGHPVEYEYIDRLVAALPAGEYDVFRLAEQLVAAGGPLPALRCDCGESDFLIESNRAFHAHLEAIGYPHEYEEHPGEHNWPYWRDRFASTIDFVLRHLG